MDRAFKPQAPKLLFFLFRHIPARNIIALAVLILPSGFEHGQRAGLHQRGDFFGQVLAQTALDAQATAPVQLPRCPQCGKPMHPKGAKTKRVKARTGSKSGIVLVPYDRAYEEGFEDMQRRVPDLTKIRGLTGYEPKVHLDEILDRVVGYFTSDATRL